MGDTWGWHSIRRLAILTLAAMFAGCGEPYVVHPTPGGRWHASPSSRVAPWGLERRGQFPFEAPEARHGVPDTVPRGMHRLVVTVTHDRRLAFRNREWTLAGGDAERAAALDALHEEIERLSPTGVRGRDSPVPVMLNADREARWGDVRDVIALLVRRLRPPVDRLQWTVQKPARGASMRQEATLVATAPGEAASTALRITLTAAERGGQGLVVEVRCDENAWSIGPDASELSNPLLVNRANLVWAALDERLPATAGSGDAAVVALEGRGAGAIPWGYVVEAFDLLLERGVRTVDVPDIDLRLELAPPRPVRSYEGPDDPWIQPVHVALMALAVLLAALVTLAPLRRKPRSRGTRPRAGGTT